MEGVFIVFTPKIAVGRKGTRRLRATLIFQPGNSTRTLRAMGSEYPALYPEYPGKAGRNFSLWLF